VLTLDAFRGNIFRDAFAYGIFAPSARPFTFAPKPSIYGRLHIRLSWCTAGTLSLQDAGFVNLPAEVRLSGAADVEFLDQGSGTSPSLNCCILLFWRLRRVLKRRPLLASMGFVGALGLAF
jgi:hypothetical protein